MRDVKFCLAEFNRTSILRSSENAPIRGLMV